MGIAQKRKYGVKTVGTGVELDISGAQIVFDYETALRLSQMLRMAGKEAKRNAGDVSRHWNTIAMLGDAETHDKAHQLREF